jgi:hypothetical protein
MTKKQGIRAVIFLAVLIGLLWWIDKTLRFEATKANLLITRRFNEMYTDTEDTWDGILLGTSDVDRAWAAPLAYEEYGMTAYPMSTDAGPFVLIPNLIEEVLKRQDLSFVVVELHGVSDENLDTDSVKIRRVTDNMRRSANWLDTISTGIEYLEQYSPEMIPYGDSALLRLSYYFPLIQFHSRLMTDSFSWKDIDPGTTKMKGVFTAVSCYQTRRVSLTAQETYPDIQPRQQELIDAVIDCAEEHGLQLLFLNVATDLSETTQSSIAAAVRYVQEQGYPVLDLGSAEVLSASGLDGESDFFDESHLNALGAHKFTPFLAQWIEEQVELSDHRGDERYQSWEDAAENYNEWYEEALVHIRKWIKKHGIDN